MKVEKILGKKGPIYSIHPDNTVCEAAELMIEKRIGALMVLDEDHNIEGIITERDVLRGCANKNTDVQCRSVKEMMTPKEKLMMANKDQDLRSLMNCMTENNIRHMPILDNDTLVGLISIRDVVKILLERAEFENKQIIDYMDTTRIEIDRIYG